MQEEEITEIYKTFMTKLEDILQSVLLGLDERLDFA